MIKPLLLTIGLLLSPISLAADINFVIDIIECESSGKHNVYGDSGKSYGIAQFNQETFYRFAKKSGYRRMYYQNPIHQMRLLNWALDNGYGRHWSCYTKILQEREIIYKYLAEHGK